MKQDLKTRHGGRILADALAAQGVKLAFGVPGESYLPVLDGLRDLRKLAERAAEVAAERLRESVTLLVAPPLVDEQCHPGVTATPVAPVMGDAHRRQTGDVHTVDRP